MACLKNKNILITGVMSNRSIAYGIAKSMHEQGANLAFTYVNEQFKKRVSDLVAPFNPHAILPCDVANDQEINAVFSELGKVWDQLDGLVHAIAFAPQDQLTGDFIENVNREGFQVAHDISSYSLCALAKASRSMFKEGGSIVALSYLGAQKAVSNYNTMGLAKASLEAAIRYSAMALGPQQVRVNGISAGPVRTLAASGIKGFRKMLDYNAKVAPLKRNVSLEEIGQTAAFLASDHSSAITGEILYVDCGYHMVGVPHFEEENS